MRKESHTSGESIITGKQQQQQAEDEKLIITTEFQHTDNHEISGRGTPNERRIKHNLRKSVYQLTEKCKALAFDIEKHWALYCYVPL